MSSQPGYASAQAADGGLPVSRRRFLTVAGAAAAAGPLAAGRASASDQAAGASDPATGRPDVAAFYFPQWHVGKRRRRR